MQFEYFDNKNYMTISKNENVSTLVAKAIEAYGLKLDKNLKIKNF